MNNSAKCLNFLLASEYCCTKRLTITVAKMRNGAGSTFFLVVCLVLFSFGSVIMEQKAVTTDKVNSMKATNWYILHKGKSRCSLGLAVSWSKFFLRHRKFSVFFFLSFLAFPNSWNLHLLVKQIPFFLIWTNMYIHFIEFSAVAT